MAISARKFAYSTANPVLRSFTNTSALLNIKELRRLLSGELEGSSPATQEDATVPDFPMTMPAALEALQEMKQVDAVMQRLQGSEAERLLVAVGRAAGAAPAQVLQR